MYQNKELPDSLQDWGVEENEGGGTRNKSLSRLVATVFPAGGFTATIFSTAASVIGAGLFGLPTSFLQSGMVMGCVYLVLVTLGNIYTMCLLAKLSDRTGCFSMEELSNLYLNKPARILLGVLRFLFCFGCCVAYVISVGDILSSILKYSHGVPAFLLTNWGLKVLQVAFWCAILFPVVVPHQINSLRYISAVGVVFILFLVGVIIAHAAQHGLAEHPRKEIIEFGTGNIALCGIGNFIFSFTCQFNCMEIYREMNPKTKSLKNYTICACVSIFLCCFVYLLGGIFGYLDFGPEATTSLLTLYNPIAEPQILVSYIGVLIKLSSSYALLFAGSRNAVYEFLGWDYLAVPFWRHFTVVTIISILILLCGLFIPSINTVFAFTGGFCGGGISFIYPSYLTMYSGNWNTKTVGMVNYIATHVILAAGVFAVVVGTASTFYDVL